MVSVVGGITDRACGLRHKRKIQTSRDHRCTGRFRLRGQPHLGCQAGWARSRRPATSKSSQRATCYTWARSSHVHPPSTGAHESHLHHHLRPTTPSSCSLRMMRPEDAGAESAWADAALDTSLSGGLSAPPYPPQPPQPLTESPAPMSGAYHNKPGIYTGGLTTPPRGRSPADPEHDSLSISAAPAAVQTAERYAHQLRQRYQLVLDRATLFPAQRWGLTTGVLLVFILRVLICEGWWYLVCYALFIFLLSRFLLFLTPKFDPSFDEDQEVDDLEAGGREPPSAQQASSKGLMNGMFEPASPEDEFRPFVRRLPEFTVCSPSNPCGQSRALAYHSLRPVLAIGDSGHTAFSWRLILRNFRRPCLLADPASLLHHTTGPHHAPPD